MAKEIVRLFKETNLSECKVFAMGEHEAGVISFGKNLKEAGQILLDQFLHL